MKRMTEMDGRELSGMYHAAMASYEDKNYSYAERLSHLILANQYDAELTARRREGKTI